MPRSVLLKKIKSYKDTMYRNILIAFAIGFVIGTVLTIGFTRSKMAKMQIGMGQLVAIIEMENTP